MDGRPGHGVTLSPRLRRLIDAKTDGAVAEFDRIRYMVGEKRPEIITASPGFDPNDVVAAIRRYEERNGSFWRDNPDRLLERTWRMINHPQGWGGWEPFAAWVKREIQRRHPHTFRLVRGRRFNKRICDCGARVIVPIRHRRAA